MTKEERRAYYRAWAAKNRTKIREYYAAHKDTILANRKKVRHGTASHG